MLDMGFAEELEAILGELPAARQTALFTATMPKRITAIAERHLKDPVRLAIAEEKVARGVAPRVRQVAYLVSRAQKVDALGRILDLESPASALVFCRTRSEVETLAQTLNGRGFRAEALHGGMSQKRPRPRDAPLPGRRRRAAAGHRRGRARPRHRPPLARHQLRRAPRSRVVRPSHRAHRPGRTRGSGHHAGRAARAAAPPQHREADRPAPRPRHRAVRRRPAGAAHGSRRGSR